MPYPTSFHFQAVWNISLGRSTVQLPRAVTTCSHPVPASPPSPWHWQCPANRFIAAQQGQIPHPASPRAGTHWKGMASSSELLPFPPAVVHNLHSHHHLSSTNTAQRKQRPDHDLILTMISKAVNVFLSPMHRGVKLWETKCQLFCKIVRIQYNWGGYFFSVPLHSGHWLHFKGYHTDLTHRGFSSTTT